MPSIGTLIRGRYICSMPMRKDLIQITRSPMRGKDCGPVRKAALGDTPCHGDVFHIQKQCESLANVLARVAMGATSRRKVLDVKMDAAKANSCGIRYRRH